MVGGQERKIISKRKEGNEQKFEEKNKGGGWKHYSERLACIKSQKTKDRGKKRNNNKIYTFLSNLKPGKYPKKLKCQCPTG